MRASNQCTQFSTRFHIITYINFKSHANRYFVKLLKLRYYVFRYSDARRTYSMPFFLDPFEAFKARAFLAEPPFPPFFPPFKAR